MKLFNHCRKIIRKEDFYDIIRKARYRIAFLVAPKDNLFFTKSLAIETELDQIAANLSSVLSQDKLQNATQDSVQNIIAANAPWFQRIELPKYGITTTSNPDWAVYEGASDNTLGGRLTPDKACVLRPLPKWAFISPRLPKIKGRSVLEVGCNAGFFSFKFTELGASRVVGIDAIARYIQQAELLRDLLEIENVHFMAHDWCIEEMEESFDLVFSSEVICHCIFPFLGIYKLLAKAREFVVLDLTVNYAKQAVCSFVFFTGHNQYHTFSFSDLMLTEFFIRCGIPEDAITKYPYANTRMLYIVNVKEFRPKARLLDKDDPVQSGRFDDLWLRKNKASI